MNEILLNMANHLLIEYCKERGIDCSGTYCRKDGRGFSYTLRYKQPDHWPVLDCARITFHKSSVPTYGWQ